MADPENQQDAQEAEPAGPVLTPVPFPEGWIPGRYAPFPITQSDIFGPDQLGAYKSAISDLDETVTRADSSARVWEVLQAWEAELFSRGYHYLQGGRKGFGLFGAVNGAGASGYEIMQSHNAGKLFPCNIYAAREQKFVAAVSRQVPGLTFVPKTDSPMDQTAADEKKKYLKAWITEAEIAEAVARVAFYFYNCDRAVLYTHSWADQQAWGTETPEQSVAFGEAQAEGVTPENELDPPAPQSDAPAVRELTRVFGKLESKVPIFADKQRQMNSFRVADEVNVNLLKERWPWIKDKIKAGGSTGGGDQLDRQARINVRLAVQTSSSSGESWQQDATETFTWYRPSQYHAIKDNAVRELFFETFPDGLFVAHAGGEFAACWNESMDAHLVVMHPTEGSGQNRRAIGSNYLPLQKVLNANITLQDRYLRSAVPRRFHDSEAINSEAISGQMNDPAKSTGLMLKAGQSIDSVTGIEKTPQPTTGLFEFIQWLIEGAPEAMDGMSPAMFGLEDADTFGATKLNRDQALQVLSMPWRNICMGFARAAEQAAECAASNRVTNIAFNVPGQDKLEIELSKMQGDALCYPESLEIPQTIAEQEAQMANLLENGKNVAIYQAIASDPRNLVEFGKFPSLANLEIPGLDAVEQQQGEFELLMKSGPLDNPELLKAQQQLTVGETHPEAQTPEGQQAMAQLQQAMQSIPPKISSVPVVQDGSENHAVHAEITLGFMTSAAGRKLKYGNDEQRAIFENFSLHWKEHVEMGEKLTPPKEMEFKGSLSIDPSKFSPEVQAKVFQAAGLQVSPEEATGDASLVPHEIVTEKEGVGADGVPVKQKIAMVGKALR